MLNMMRKFTVGVSFNSREIIESKMEELSIIPISKKCHANYYNDKPATKMYFECMENEEKMDKLIEYLKHEYEGLATIIY